MTEHNFIGRYALRVKVLLLAWLFSGAASAAPVEDFSDAVAQALEAVEGAWADSLISAKPGTEAFDEQIFTEISPIIDSPEGVRLPQDQLLTD